MKVKLFARDGRLLHEAEIPPFQEQPDVIVEGSRFFIVPWLDGDIGASWTDDIHHYREAIVYAIPDPASLRPESGRPCGCDPGANWTCEEHRSVATS